MLLDVSFIENMAAFCQPVFLLSIKRQISVSFSENNIATIVIIRLLFASTKLLFKQLNLLAKWSLSLSQLKKQNLLQKGLQHSSLRTLFYFLLCDHFVYVIWELINSSSTFYLSTAKLPSLVAHFQDFQFSAVAIVVNCLYSKCHKMIAFALALKIG